MHTEKASDPMTCTESWDILLCLIKGLFNKFKKCMTRDSTFPHFSFSRSQFSKEDFFSTDWAAEGIRKIWHFLCFLMLSFLKEE